MGTAKQFLKYFGNILVIVSFIFIARKILRSDVDYSVFQQTNIILAFFVAFLVQTFLNLFGCYPWAVFVGALSNIKVPFKSAMTVFVTANIYKYLPGNVFQYVGRNKLALDLKIKHFDVVLATVLDISMCIFSVFIVAVFLLNNKIFALIEQYLIHSFVVCFLFFVFSMFLFFVFRKKIFAYALDYFDSIKKANKKKIIYGFLYYFFNASLSAVTYIVVLYLINNDFNFQDLMQLSGAFSFAWIVGFVMIGAPGGIGIRESIMLGMSSGSFSDSVLIFVLLMRLSSICADILAFLFVKVRGEVSH